MSSSSKEGCLFFFAGAWRENRRLKKSVASTKNEEKNPQFSRNVKQKRSRLLLPSSCFFARKIIFTSLPLLSPQKKWDMLFFHAFFAYATVNRVRNTISFLRVGKHEFSFEFPASRRFVAFTRAHVSPFPSFGCMPCILRPPPKKRGTRQCS